MGHPALQVIKDAHDFLKKNGMKNENLDKLEIISDEEMKRQKQIQKDFENGK